jgi:hypothetical protein
MYADRAPAAGVAVVDQRTPSAPETLGVGSLRSS